MKALVFITHLKPVVVAHATVEGLGYVADVAVGTLEVSTDGIFTELRTALVVGTDLLQLHAMVADIGNVYDALSTDTRLNTGVPALHIRITIFAGNPLYSRCEEIEISRRSHSLRDSHRPAKRRLVSIPAQRRFCEIWGPGYKPPRLPADR